MVDCMYIPASRARTKVDDAAALGYSGRDQINGFRDVGQAGLDGGADIGVLRMHRLWGKKKEKVKVRKRGKNMSTGCSTRARAAA